MYHYHRKVEAALKHYSELGRDVFVVGGDVKLSSAGARMGRR